MYLYLTDEKATHSLAKTLANQAILGDVYLLEGDLGSGKTSFARSFIRSFGCDKEEVPSPTFTVLQQYPLKEYMIWHYDLYRLKDPSELEELGIDDAFREGISLIEWPDRLGTWHPQSYFLLKFEIKSESERTIYIKSSPDYSDRLRSLHDQRT